MYDTHVAAAQEAGAYDLNRKAAVAAAKARRLWPNVIGEVLAAEIIASMELPGWMRTESRSQQLIEAILGISEGEAVSSHCGR